MVHLHVGRNNLGLDKAANDTAAGFCPRKDRGDYRGSRDGQLLQPNNHPIGTKRICIDTDYFAAFNRSNVTLVDIKSNPIERSPPTPCARVAERSRCAVLATGFDAMTGSVAKIDISGRNVRH